MLSNNVAIRVPEHIFTHGEKATQNGTTDVFGLRVPAAGNYGAVVRLVSVTSALSGDIGRVRIFKNALFTGGAWTGVGPGSVVEKNTSFVSASTVLAQPVFICGFAGGNTTSHDLNGVNFALKAGENLLVRVEQPLAATTDVCLTWTEKQ